MALEFRGVVHCLHRRVLLSARMSGGLPGLHAGSRQPLTRVMAQSASTRRAWGPTRRLLGLLPGIERISVRDLASASRVLVCGQVMAQEERTRSPALPVGFGEMLRHHRRAAGLTQQGLAERAGLSEHGIQKLESGASHP